MFELATKGEKGQHLLNRVKFIVNERMNCEESAILFTNLAYPWSITPTVDNVYALISGALNGQWFHA